MITASSERDELTRAMKGKKSWQGEAQSVVTKCKIKASLAAYLRTKKLTTKYSRRHQWTLNKQPSYLLHSPLQN